MLDNARIVVLVSGGGSNLQSVIDKLHLKTYTNLDGSTCQRTAEVVAVISNRPDVLALSLSLIHI